MFYIMFHGGDLAEITADSERAKDALAEGIHTYSVEQVQPLDVDVWDNMMRNYVKNVLSEEP